MDESTSPRTILTLMDLCDYSLIHIFSYLNSINLYQLSRTCKRFEELVTERKLWIRIDARDKPINGDVVNYCLDRIGTHTKSLYFAANNRSVELLPYDLLKRKACENLRILALENQMIRGDLLSLSEYPETLVELSFRKSFIVKYNPFFRNCIGGMTNLKVLILDECGWVEDQIIMPLSKLPKLEVLSMYMCKKLSDMAMPYLSLSGCYGFKTLRILDLRFTGFGDQVIKTFYKHKTLQELYFHSYTTMFVLDKARREMEIALGLQSERRSYPSLYDEIPDTNLKAMVETFGKYAYQSHQMQSITDDSVWYYKDIDQDLTQEYELDSVLYERPYGKCKCGFRDGVDPISISKDFASNKEEIERLEQIIAQERNNNTLQFFLLSGRLFGHDNDSNDVSKLEAWMKDRVPRNEHEIALIEHCDLLSFQTTNTRNIVIDFRTMPGTINYVANPADFNLYNDILGENQRNIIINEEENVEPNNENRPGTSQDDSHEKDGDRKKDGDQSKHSDQSKHGDQSKDGDQTKDDNQIKNKNLDDCRKDKNQNNDQKKDDHQKKPDDQNDDNPPKRGRKRLNVNINFNPNPNGGNEINLNIDPDLGILRAELNEINRERERSNRFENYEPKRMLDQIGEKIQIRGNMYQRIERTAGKSSQLHIRMGCVAKDPNRDPKENPVSTHVSVDDGKKSAERDSRDETNKPGPSRDETNKPGPSRDETNKPGPSRDETNKPGPSRDETNKPGPSRDETNKPGPSRDETNKPGPSRQIENSNESETSNEGNETDNWCDKIERPSSRQSRGSQNKQNPSLVNETGTSSDDKKRKLDNSPQGVKSPKKKREETTNSSRDLNPQGKSHKRKDEKPDDSMQKRQRQDAQPGPSGLNPNVRVRIIPNFQRLRTIELNSVPGPSRDRVAEAEPDQIAPRRRVHIRNQSMRFFREHIEVVNNSIKYLSFRGYKQVTDVSLDYLSKYKLELLDVTQTSITKQGVNNFMLHNPQCRVVHESACVCLPKMHF